MSGPAQPPVCVGDATVALERFLASYVEDLRNLYVQRSFDASALDPVVYGDLTPGAFHTAASTLVGLQGEAMFLVQHVGDAWLCAFGWVSGPLDGAEDGQFGRPEGEVRFFYARRPVERADLLADARAAVESLASRVPLGEARSSRLPAEQAAAQEVTRGAVALQAGPAEPDATGHLARLGAHFEMPEITRALAQTRHLTLHLPGELALLPLLALPLDGQQPLVETHSVTGMDRLTSLLSLPGLNAVPGIAIDRSGNHVTRALADYELRLMLWSGQGERGRAVFGDPGGFDSDAYGGLIFPPLPGARREAEWLAGRLDAELVIGQAATGGRLLSALQSTSLVHFAGHGVASAEAPLDDSYLVMADGPLTAREIQDQMLPAPLVILSACDTGRGQALGAGVIGLARAFQKAGALGTVLSHWPVSDESAVPLMLAFHDELERHTPPQALRHAALRLREDYPDPADWAAFGYFGTPLVAQSQ
ncbi:CHAT domain-containing protein [Alkalilacustris brevis]|uniref:CHAT domain-containing protein n=1 Tax=Alkalilacustris brevis TaxID=2026338 RepID=UPI00138FC770|nr:CHAT domain-containing protein [Alkalilacustris brevis]